MGKVALVTGGSRGIGKEIVIQLAKKGIKVIANYNNSKKNAEEIKEELEKQNIYIDIMKADVSKRDEVRAMVEKILEKYKKIDILINNAGISEYKMFSDETDDDWNRVINTNLYSAFVTTQEILPSMIKQKSGNIINISSIWGIVGASYEVLYSISKAGMDGMTKALAKEVGPSNIRINSIAPGIIETEMNEEYKNEIEEIKKDIPLRKTATPVEIVKCINWLIEDEYTTGQVISINGGWVIT